MLDEAFAIVREIMARGHLAVIAGGAVRDLLLGRPLTDVDLATDMPPNELASVFTTHAVGRSAAFDTVVIARGGHAYEISSFRHGAREFSDPLREDTAHRDFTINALLMGADGAIIDLQGGRADLRDRVIRCVGSPEERFTEDPARVLRAVRFAACLDFTIEERTAAAVGRYAPLLKSVAGERIGKEILKAASQPGAALAAAVALMEQFGMLGPILPEVGALRGVPHPGEWHPEGDAWEHTLAALRTSASTDPAVNLGLLLNEAVNHPAHREAAVRSRGGGRAEAEFGIADAVSRRLHLPRRQRAAIAFAVAHHPQAGRFTELRRSEILALLAGEHWPVLRSLALSDVAARGDTAAVAHLDAAFRAAEADAAASAERRQGAPPISGTRVMELTGLAPGPLVGEILHRANEWALDNRVEDRGRIEAEVVRIGVKKARREAPGGP